jgi:hypothetical protein
MWRKAAIVAAVTVLGTVTASAVSGYAANLSYSSGSLGGGKSSVPMCGASVSVTQVLNGSNQISGVTVGSIPSSCGGATLAATVSNGTSNSSGSVTVPASGGSVTVTLGTPLTFKDSYETDITITGP